MSDEETTLTVQALWKRALHASGLRQTAVEALAAAHDLAYLDLLLSVTDDDEPATRMAAHEAVRKLLPQLPRARLVAAGQDDRPENTTMRWQALEELANRRDEAALAPLVDLARTPGANHFLAYSNLIKFGHESAIEVLIDQLRTEPSFPLRMVLAQRLTQHLPAERSLIVLGELLHDPDSNLRRFVASQILSRYVASAPAEVIDAARQILKEARGDAQQRGRVIMEGIDRKREQQRAVFAREVAETGEPRTFAGWLPHLRNPNLEWQGLAWKTVLAMEPTPDMMEDLREALLNGDYQTAVGAAAILEWVGKHVPVTRGVVEAALRRIDSMPEDVGYDKIDEELMGAFHALGAGMPIEPLVAVLAEPNWHVRYLAMVALLWRPEALSGELLLGVLGDPNEHVRSRAISALATGHPEVFVEVVREAANIMRGHGPGPIFVPVAQIRFACEVGSIREPSSLVPEIVDSLLALLQSSAWGVRREALATLGSLTERGVLDMSDVPESVIARIQRLASDPDSRAVREAAQGILASQDGSG
jgi:HEAT repeat protein